MSNRSDNTSRIKAKRILDKLCLNSPKTPRVSSWVVYIFNRGLAKQNIFLEEKDYEKFLERLEALKNQKNFDHSVYAYVLMPNHFHLLIQTKKTPISKVMTSLLTSYSMYFNRKYKRTGVLFQNRYKSKLCDKDSYFLTASRYIHLNPIEVSLVSDLGDYKWSSYQELYGKPEWAIIDKEEVARLIGTTGKEKRAYHQFLLDGIKIIGELKKEYGFVRSDRDIVGNPNFYSLSQKKYIRRRDKEMLKTI